LYFVEFVVGVNAEFKLYFGHGGSVADRCAQFFEVLQFFDGFFNRIYHLAFDVFGVGAGINGDDHDIGYIQRRIFLLRHAQEGRDARQQQQQKCR